MNVIISVFVGNTVSVTLHHCPLQSSSLIQSSFCVDCCCFNAVTNMDSLTLLCISDTLDRIASSLWFCSFDLGIGYCQVTLTSGAPKWRWGNAHTQLWLTLSEAWSWCLQQSKWISTSIPRIVISFSTNTSSWSCGQCWGVWHKPGGVSGCATVATITQHQTAYKLLGLIVLSQHFVVYSALLDSEGHRVPVDFDWVYVGHNDVWYKSLIPIDFMFALQPASWTRWGVTENISCPVRTMEMATLAQNRLMTCGARGSRPSWASVFSSAGSLSLVPATLWLEKW